ncbi:UNVERIFIED_CONTAM: PadR family transcriptional regulator AphA [Brevibacillus sp. OAP136]
MENSRTNVFAIGLAFSTRSLGVKEMNTLSYGLLGLLARKSCSGYDLMLQLQPFWQAKHSQIYPLLANLEGEGYLQYTRVEQTEKPDKKMYTITQKGRDALQAWLAEPASAPITRDELFLKTYCLWLTDAQAAIALFSHRISEYEGKLATYQDMLADLKAKHGNTVEDFSSPFFGDFVLLHRAVRSSKDQLEWCQWVIGLLHNSKSSGRPT